MDPEQLEAELAALQALSGEATAAHGTAAPDRDALLAALGLGGVSSRNNDDGIEEDDPSRPIEQSNEVREASPAERELNFAHFRNQSALRK